MYSCQCRWNSSCENSVAGKSSFGASSANCGVLFSCCAVNLPAAMSFSEGSFGDPPDPIGLWILRATAGAVGAGGASAGSCAGASSFLAAS